MDEWRRHWSGSIGGCAHSSNSGESWKGVISLASVPGAAKASENSVAMSELTLRPMTEAEYEVFLAHQLTGYAAANVESWSWSKDEALEHSKKAYEELLP